MRRLVVLDAGDLHNGRKVGLVPLLEFRQEGDIEHFVPVFNADEGLDRLVEGQYDAALRRGDGDLLAGGLDGGIGIVPILIGLFAISDIFIFGFKKIFL